MGDQLKICVLQLVTLHIALLRVLQQLYLLLLCLLRDPPNLQVYLVLTYSLVRVHKCGQGLAYIGLLLAYNQ